MTSDAKIAYLTWEHVPAANRLDLKVFDKHGIIEQRFEAELVAIFEVIARKPDFKDCTLCRLPLPPDPTGVVAAVIPRGATVALSLICADCCARDDADNAAALQALPS